MTLSNREKKTSREVALFGSLAVALVFGVLMVEYARADNLICRNPQPGCTGQVCLDSPDECVSEVYGQTDYDNYESTNVSLGSCDDGGPGCSYFNQTTCLVNMYDYTLGDEDCGLAVCQQAVKANGCTGWHPPG